MSKEYRTEKTIVYAVIIGVCIVVAGSGILAVAESIQGISEALVIRK